MLTLFYPVRALIVAEKSYFTPVVLHSSIFLAFEKVIREMSFYATFLFNS